MNDNENPFKSNDLTDKERFDLLKAIIDSSLDAVVSIDDKDEVIEWNEAAVKIFGYTIDQAIGQKLQDLIIPEKYVKSHLEGITRYKNSGRSDILNKRIELEAKGISNNVFPVELTVSPIFFRNRIFFTARIRDISDRIEYKKQMELTAKELSHREKNSLAIVSSISRQIAKYSTNIKDFSQSFDSWLDSYKRTHELLSIDNKVQGMYLFERIREEFKPYINYCTLNLSGDDIFLNKYVSVSLGMCIHEQVTNSVKYGSLSVENGSVNVIVKIDSQFIEIEWIERGGPKPMEIRRKGFGTQLLRTALVEGLKGSYDYNFGDLGFEGKIKIPLFMNKP